MSYLGIIEGFYGKAFSFEQRLDLLDYLKQQTFNFYIYAPKADKSLRTRNFKFHKDLNIEQLYTLSCSYQQQGLDFGIAISPLDLYFCYESKKQSFLDYVDQYLQATKANILCLLFDDMIKSDESMGRIQNQIISDLYHKLAHRLKRFIFCPSYYSFDPILDKIFGQRDNNYYYDLMYKLADDIEVFFTGNKVVSLDLDANMLQQAYETFGRKCFIWDNYPVNDGKKMCKFLNLASFNYRRDLINLTTGHAINPMCEYHLNKIPLTSLKPIYQGIAQDTIIANNHKLFTQCFELKDFDEHLFTLLTQKGLDNYTNEDKAYIKKHCANINNPYHKDVIDFINNVYAFDESCLTD